jgi:hypothetical protein
VNIKDLVTAYPSLTEIGLLSRAIVPFMTDPTVNREEKRFILNDMVNQLSERSFKNEFVADQIMIIINMKEEICKEYPDVKSQVAGILSWLPRMEYHKDKLVKVVSKNRKLYKLGV